MTEKRVTSFPAGAAVLKLMTKIALHVQ